MATPTLLFTYDDSHTGSWDHYVDPEALTGDTITVAIYQSKSWPRDRMNTAALESVEVWKRTPLTLMDLRTQDPDEWNEDGNVAAPIHHIVRELNGDRVAIDGVIWGCTLDDGDSTSLPRERPQAAPAAPTVPGIPEVILAAARHYYAIDADLDEDQRSMDPERFNALHDQLVTSGAIAATTERP